ncbi:AAA family ATPase [Gordonia polyisoprenivorans]|uniref:AAA family ATPase n=1 Tax=Gordonia polyisoprenivorans TaxID=84595 RepID=UPI00035C6E17|nr:AAA family ATPase [Gordonia polyisoprenivorans]
MTTQLNTPEPVENTSAGSGVSFPELLELLGHNSFTAVGVKPVGGDFSAMVTDTADAAGMAQVADADVWFGVCPVEGPPRRGRGSAEQVTALPALWADIDVKPGACTDLGQAVDVIAAISEAIGSRPTVMIFSGHGFQPLWSIDDPDEAQFGDDHEKRTAAAALLRRWGQLVRVVGAQRNVALDSVFDLARVLRVPGTANHKGEPVAVTAAHDFGGPLTFDEIRERLDELNVPDPAAGSTLETPVEIGNEWASTTCGYTATMIRQWAQDSPSARHPWLMSQAVRLTAAHRYGCLTEAKYQEGVRALTGRMHQLCSQGEARPVGHSEIDDAFAWARGQVGFMVDERVRAELGGHEHLPDNVTELSIQDFTPIDGSTPDGENPDIPPQMIEGGAFIHDEPEGVAAVWGSGDRVLWADGEALIVCGPQGVGKTTLASNVLASLIGERPRDVLGLAVRPVPHVLYLAMDRPRQAARALRRQLGHRDRDYLTEHLTFWKGPPPYDLAKNTGLLTNLAELAHADVVIVDSLKDAAIGLSDDEVGAGWNRARQSLLASGRNLLELHHIKKISGDKKPDIADVYGSTWITSGAGSVILLNGNPGDPVVRMHHVKQPVEELGPWTLLHEQESGTVSIHGEVDIVTLAARSGGLTVKAAAKLLFETDNPNRNQIEKARRRLTALTRDGRLMATEPGKPSPTTYVAMAFQKEAS